ncbi:unnamed protein product, partial [marine sediment metagenome]
MSVIPHTWKKCPENPVLKPTPGDWDREHVGHPSIVYLDGVFYLYYSEARPYAIGLATSPDGIHFTKYAGNPM